MQEEVTRGAVTLIVDGAKLSEHVFEKAVKKFLEEIQKSQKPKIYSRERGFLTMANIQERRDKSGKLISYSIRVHRGRGADGKQIKPWTSTFEVSPTWTEKSARKKAEAFAATFEKECREGVTSDSRLKFEEYCNYVIDLKEQRGIKHSTIVRYKELAVRIYPAIRHIKLKDIRADHLNSLYTALAMSGQNKRTGEGLSAKTILEHHRLISTVLDQAEKEGLVPFNVAAKATLPKINKKEVNYFQPEQVAAIRDALEEESMKWKVLTHIFLITGARRGEILGLKWSAVDFAGNLIHICNNILYSPDVGIYEDTPKTATSDRWITLPDETIQFLRKYQVWQNTERLRLGEYYQNQNYLFAQDNGGPMHPDSVTDWMNKFSKRHDLPHINPHAFRHTMASMLYFNGVDSVSISKRLGHAQVSTTANIYAHVMEAADRKNADILADVFLKKA